MRSLEYRPRKQEAKKEEASTVPVVEPTPVQEEPTQTDTFQDSVVIN